MPKRGVQQVVEAVKAAGGTKILIRVDFNVPMDHASGSPVITDDSRIQGALPTIKAVTEQHGLAVVLCSHMGRPKLVQAGGDDEETKKQRRELSLKPVAEHLSKLLEKPVSFGGEDCLKSQDAVNSLTPGGVCLLENLRFYKQEEKNDPDFVKTLAAYADGYLNDAFGTCHRAHASVSGVPGVMKDEVCGIGLLVASELAYLDFSTAKPNEKIAAIIGGSKVSTKLPVIKGLLDSIQVLVLGGGLAFTFMKAQGIDIGSSLVEDSMVDTAKEFLEKAKKDGKIIAIPVDSVCSKEFPKEPMKLEDTKTFEMAPGKGIEEGWMGLDCGPATVKYFEEVLSDCTKICFNGPLGVFEVEPFDIGTRGLVKTLKELTANKGVTTVVGGGDSVAALKQFNEMASVSYVSTGGGATLELLAGDKLPGVEAIQDI